MKRCVEWKRRTDAGWCLFSAYLHSCSILMFCLMELMILSFPLVTCDTCSLGCNGIDDDGARALAEMLRTNTSLANIG